MIEPEPESGCTTGCSGNRYITEYSYEYQEPVVDRCNHLIDLLWILVDEYHIDEFINDCLWELVCNECD